MSDIKHEDPMMPELDFTFSERHEPPKRRVPRADPTPRPSRDKPALGLAILLACGCLFVLFACHTVGRTSGLRYADAVLADISAEASATANLYEQALDANEHLAKEAINTSATIGALRAEVESATAAAESLRIEVEDLELLNRALRNELTTKPVPQSTVPKPAAPVQTSAGAWSREQVASTLEKAAGYYALDEAQTAWIVETGVRVAYKESTYRPDARNGQYLGLFQFGSAWASAEQRLDPVWSCYRFVRVYAEAGEAGIQRHWRATV